METDNFSKNRNDFLRQAEEYLRQNNLSETLNLAAERLRNFPADTDSLGVYCEALIGLGRLEEMRELLDKVGGIISGLNLINERAGDVCRENGFHREAAACYEKFISLRPEAEKAREIIEKISFLEQEDKPFAEISLLNNKNVSEEKFLTVTMAQLYIKQGHFQDAEKILEEIIEKDPLNTQALAALDDLKAKTAPQSTVSQASSKNDLINILSSWLKNIERLKINNAPAK